MIDGRALRKRRQGVQQYGTYSGTNDFRNYQNTGYEQNTAGAGRNDKTLKKVSICLIF